MSPWSPGRDGLPAPSRSPVRGRPRKRPPQFDRSMNLHEEILTGSENKVRFLDVDQRSPMTPDLADSSTAAAEGALRRAISRMKESSECADQLQFFLIASLVASPILFVILAVLGHEGLGAGLLGGLAVLSCGALAVLWQRGQAGEAA